MKSRYRDITDEELALRARHDDEEAFEELVLRHQSSVLRWIVSIDRRPERVEDLAQEAFIKAWRARRDFRGDSSWRTWLMRIALRVCLDRKRKLEPATEMVDENTLPDGILIPEPNGAERIVIDRMHIEMLRETLDNLQPEKRAVLVLRYMEGYNSAEIGKMIGKPPGTVRRMLFQARQALREAMTEQYRGAFKREKI